MDHTDVRDYRLAAYRLAHERLREALTRGSGSLLALRSATDALIGQYDLTWREWDLLLESLADTVAVWAEADGADDG